MSDPPITSQPETQQQDQQPQSDLVVEQTEEEQSEHVTDGYIRVPEVLFNWAAFLDPWQANPIKALTNANSLTHPDHPLREKGQEHLRLYNLETLVKEGRNVLDVVSLWNQIAALSRFDNSLFFGYISKFSKLKVCEVADVTGRKPEGHEYLCFSLKQIEYLQFYIHEMRLADPAWTEYLAKISSGNDEDQPKDGETIPEPPYIEEENRWVPMPGNIIRASDLAEVELVDIVEPRDIKKMLNQQKRLNVQADRKLVNRAKLTPEELSKVEAYEENTAPGPGLRRGPVKVHERRQPEKEREEGTGWGGFPTKTAGEEDEVVLMEKSGHVAWQEESTEAKEISLAEKGANSSEPAVPNPPKDADGADQIHASTPSVPRDGSLSSSSAPSLKAANGTVDSAKAVNGAPPPAADDEEDLDPRPDALAEQLNKLVDLQAKIDSGSPTSPATKDMKDDAPKVEDPIERYFYDAQQAFVLASAGGLKTALDQKLKDDKESAPPKEEEEEAEVEIEVPDVPAEIGRSLCFALELTTWEEDENVVLEVGWAATWWQEKLVEEGTEEKKAGEKKEDAPVGKAEQEESRFERMTEHGHIIVQDHLLDKRNGKTKPDHRSSFGFGTSTPLLAKDVHRTLSQKLKDLSKRAGSGPIYLLLHSADTDETDFKKLGWKTGGWEKQIRPADWEYPSYASPAGVGRVFLIDTAKLFGAIEDDKSILPATGKTRKRLEVVAGIMFGSIPEQAPKACGNAGNHAAYCLQIFLGIVDGLPLEVLRADYQQSQIPIPVDPTPEDDDDDDDDTVTVKPVQDGNTPSPKLPEPKIVAPPDAEAARARAIKAEKLPVIATPTSRPVAVSNGNPQKGAMTPAAEAVPANGGENADEDEDDEDEGIRGVFWEDRNGNIVELSE